MSEYGEPWRVVPGCSEPFPDRVGTAHTCAIHSAHSPTKHIGDILIQFDGSDREFAARIVACVNACKGIPTETLNSIRFAPRYSPEFTAEQLRQMQEAFGPKRTENLR